MAHKELKDYIREHGLKPGDLFDADELLDDPGVKRRIQTEAEYQIYLKEKEAEEELNKQMDEEIKKEEELKSKENPLIPGSEENEEKDKNFNELIPSDDSEEENGPGSNELIPE